MKKMAVAVLLLLALTLSASAALTLGGTFSTEFVWTPEGGVTGYNQLATSFRLGGLPSGMTLTYESDPATYRAFWDAPRFNLPDLIAGDRQGRVVYYSLSTSGALWQGASNSTVTFGNFGVNLGNEFYNRNFQWSPGWRRRNEQLRGVRVTNIDVLDGSAMAFWGYDHTIYNADPDMANTHRYSPHYGLQWEGNLLGALDLNTGFATYVTPKLINNKVADIVVTNRSNGNTLSVPRQDVNRSRDANDLILYRDPWGQPAYTGTNQHGLEIVFEPTSVPGRYRAVSVSPNGNVHRHLIPAGGFALSGHSAGRTKLGGLNVSVGDLVDVENMEFLFTPAQAETVAMADGTYSLPMDLGSVSFRGGYLSSVDNDRVQPETDSAYAVKVDGSLDLKDYVPLSLFTIKGGYREVEVDFTPAYMFYNSGWHTTNDNVAGNAPFEFMRGEQGWSAGLDLGVEDGKVQFAFNSWTSDFASRKNASNRDSWNAWFGSDYSVAGWDFWLQGLRTHRVTTADAVNINDTITSRARGDVAGLPLDLRYIVGLRHQGNLTDGTTHNRTTHTVDLLGTNIADVSLTGQYRLTDNLEGDDRFVQEASLKGERGWRLDGWNVNFSDEVEWKQADSSITNTANVTASKRVDVPFFDRMRVQSNYGLEVVNTFVSDQDVTTVLSPTASWSTTYDVWNFRRVSLNADASVDVFMTGALLDDKYVTGDYKRVYPNLALSFNYSAPIGLAFEGGVAWPNRLNARTTYFRTSYSVNF